MYFRKLFVCALFVCFCTQACYVKWSSGALCVCEDGSNQVVAQLPNAKKCKQNDVFYWLKQRGISVGYKSQAFNIWVAGAYKSKLGCAWRWEWPWLWRTDGVEESCETRQDFEGNVYTVLVYCYDLAWPTRVDQLTQDELYWQLSYLPGGVATTIVADFNVQMEKARAAEAAVGSVSLPQ